MATSYSSLMVFVMGKDFYLDLLKAMRNTFRAIDRSKRGFTASLIVAFVEVTSMSKLQAGDWVEVRSKEEILRTLDKQGRLDGLPFMPQMFQYCGKRFRVFKRAHKTCDTIAINSDSPGSKASPTEFISISAAMERPMAAARPHA